MRTERGMLAAKVLARAAYSALVANMPDREAREMLGAIVTSPGLAFFPPGTSFELTVHPPPAARKRGAAVLARGAVKRVNRQKAGDPARRRTAAR